ncbi:MAG: hypothetical protein AABY78_07030 [Nitrospirota bacterium]|jgi:hypothetical protein
MKIILMVILIIALMTMIVSGDTPSLMIVRTNPTGQWSPVFSEPLMTYKQGERVIRQNEEIIRLLKDIERNTRKR